MSALDQVLMQRLVSGQPVQVALVGAGYIARGIAAHMVRTPGVELAAISNRTLANARAIFEDVAGARPVVAATPGELDDAVTRGLPVVADDPAVVCRSESIDVVLEATGEVEFGAASVLDAIEHGKHVVLLNAELDATVGPLLKAKADEAGVVITNTEGDEPGAAMNLMRYLTTIGLRPVATGNIKGFLDRYRTPETQREFAAAVGQDAKKVASYADGSKLSFEMAVLANATGFGVARRGMNGYRVAHVNEVLEQYAQHPHVDGMVDYCLGAEPGSGVFVVSEAEDATVRTYLGHLKLGDGPLYLWYLPWHLPQAEAPLTAARAALFRYAAVAPLDGPRCEVFAVAKRDLEPGEMLDGSGGFTCYGSIDNVEATRAEGLLPMGVSSGCTLVRSVPVDQAVTYDDVRVPDGRLIDRLRREQDELFPSAAPAAGTPELRS